VLSGENLKAGHVLGRRLVAPTFGAAAALGTNVGNGVFGAVTMGTNAGARRGTYRIVFTEPAAAAGKFEVFGPDGILIGDGDVAVLFDNEIQFTIADGAADFVAGDAFTVKVTAGTYKYKEYDVADADGGQRVAGVLYNNVDASAADKNGVALRRDAEIRAADLTWFAGATQAQKDEAIDALEALGIIVRL
jgi:head decoration protein D